MMKEIRELQRASSAAMAEAALHQKRAITWGDVKRAERMTRIATACRILAAYAEGEEPYEVDNQLGRAISEMNRLVSEFAWSRR